MKIRVKHKQTEIIISDDEFNVKDNRSLIYNNQTYILTLIQTVVQQIQKLQKEEHETI